jgi:hypothetical protein
MRHALASANCKRQVVVVGSGSNHRGHTLAPTAGVLSECRFFAKGKAAAFCAALQKKFEGGGRIGVRGL